MSTSDWHRKSTISKPLEITKIVLLPAFDQGCVIDPSSLYSPMNPKKDDLHLKVSWARLYENPATNVGPQPLYRLQHFWHRRTELLVNTKAVIIIFVNVCNEREKGDYTYI